MLQEAVELVVYYLVLLLVSVRFCPQVQSSQTIADLDSSHSQRRGGLSKQNSVVQLEKIGLVKLSPQGNEQILHHIPG